MKEIDTRVFEVLDHRSIKVKKILDEAVGRLDYDLLNCEEQFSPAYHYGLYIDMGGYHTTAVGHIKEDGFLYIHELAKEIDIRDIFEFHIESLGL